MTLPTPTDRTGRTAAALAATGFAGIALFQLALAAGAPWGHAAWGGAHAHLTTAERTGSAIAVAVWLAAALVVLGRAGLRAGQRGTRLNHWGTWLLAAISLLAALLNFASNSHWENAIFGPLALMLTTLCLIVARSPLDQAQTPPPAGAPFRSAAG
jgi:hypothetical protein